MKTTNDYTEYDKDLAQIREVINETVWCINARRELFEIGFTRDEWIDRYPNAEELIASRKARTEASDSLNYYRRKYFKDNDRTSVWMTPRFVSDFVHEYMIEAADPYAGEVSYTSDRMNKIPLAEL